MHSSSQLAPEAHQIVTVVQPWTGLQAEAWAENIEEEEAMEEDEEEDEEVVWE